MDGGEKSGFPSDRAVRILLIALLSIACVFMVYLTVLVRRVLVTLETNGERIEKVFVLAAGTAEKVERGEARVTKWLEGIGAARAADVLDEVADVAKGLGRESAGPDANAQAEIAHLLSRIRSSGLTFEGGGKPYSATRLYLQLYGKYKLYEKSLGSAEDFIGRVAAKGVTGRKYSVVEKDGAKRELGEWPREALAEHRAGRK